MEYYVYILASKRNGTLYVGFTNELSRRVQQHKDGLVPGFTQQYNVKQLVYYESFNDVEQATVREKRLKKWNRSWKIQLIEKDNPEWKDLSDQILF